MSGITRSTPSISASGNMRPTSTTMRSSAYSKTIMLLPISPSPPRGMTRSLPLFMSDLEETPLRGDGHGGPLRIPTRLLQYGRELLEVGLDDATEGALVEGGRRVVHGHHHHVADPSLLAVDAADGVAGGVLCHLAPHGRGPRKNPT